MNQYKIIIRDDKEYHFKLAIKAFDSSAIVIFNDKENYYSVSTNLNIEELKQLSSVKEINQLNTELNTELINDTVSSIDHDYNDKYYNKLINKWTLVLDGSFAKPLTSFHDKKIISELLENQVKLNKGYLPESTYITKELSVFQQYALPLIRIDYLDLLAFKFCETLPSSTPTSTYNVKRIINNILCNVNGSVIPTIKDIKSKYNINTINNNPIYDKHILECLQIEYNYSIDRLTVDKMIECSLSPNNGGENNIKIINFNTFNRNICEEIVSEIFTRSSEIENLTGISYGNFVICSNDIYTQISKSSFYKSNNYEYRNFQYVGTLLDNNREINIIVDNISKESYSLVGLRGKNKGESGIVFLPQIPYIFTKDTTDDTVNIKTRYGLISDIIGSGSFYRYTKYIP